MTSKCTDKGCRGCQYLKQIGDPKRNIFVDYKCIQNPKRFAQVESERPECYSEIPPPEMTMIEQIKEKPELTPLDYEEFDNPKPNTKGMNAIEKDMVAFNRVRLLIERLFKVNSLGYYTITGDLKSIAQRLREIDSIVKERLEDKKP